MKKKEFDYIVQFVTDGLIGFLMEDYKLPILEAFDKVYRSDTLRKLQDKSTGLYLRSAAYTYEYLKKELQLP
ncbi:MAG: hypothetical protein IKH61_06935 [Bacteroidales bacterium]|jgi:hypothetical protein|nr:hypothetical protein [Bacteroidales bacterium]